MKDDLPRAQIMHRECDQSDPQDHDERVRALNPVICEEGDDQQQRDKRYSNPCARVNVELLVGKQEIGAAVEIGQQRAEKSVRPDDPPIEEIRMLIDVKNFQLWRLFLQGLS